MSDVGPFYWTPWTAEPWGDGTANVENADGDTVCRDISIVEANTIVLAVNSHASLLARIAELEAGLRRAIEIGGKLSNRLDNSDHGQEACRFAFDAATDLDDIAFLLSKPSPTSTEGVKP